MIPIYKPYISKFKHSAISAINDEWILKKLNKPIFQSIK